jgi:hypothetical protein
MINATRIFGEYFIIIIQLFKSVALARNVEVKLVLPKSFWIPDKEHATRQEITSATGNKASSKIFKIANR